MVEQQPRKDTQFQYEWKQSEQRSLRPSDGVRKLPNNPNVKPNFIVLKPCKLLKSSRAYRIHLTPAEISYNTETELGQTGS